MTSLALAVFLGVSTRVPDVDSDTRVLLRLLTAVTTRTARVGDPVQLRTASPVVVDGVSIPIGTDVRGVVTRARRAGRVRGEAELEFAIVSIARPDGTIRPVDATYAVVPIRRRPQLHPPDSGRPTILAGMAAGYATAWLASQRSHSEDTIVRSGVIGGLATGVALGVLKRGEDLVLRRGQTIDVVLPIR